MDRHTTVRAFSASDVLSSLSKTMSQKGNTIVHGMPVFKSGTFKDSMGDKATWTPWHLDQMVSNFDMLRAGGVFPNVPVRDGHRGLFSNGGQVIGYVVQLTHDQANGVLLADYEITEPDAMAKLERGTFRARSAEIGMYEDNNESLYFPVFTGFAFVDVPAVEGLYSRAATTNKGEHDFVLATEKAEEIDVAPEQQQQQPKPQAFTIKGVSTTDPGQVQTHITELEAAIAASGKDHANHAAATAKAGFKFRVNGQETDDFTAVQTALSAFETARAEGDQLARKAFVTALATSNKITQPQVEAMTEAVLEMSDQAYGKFQAAYSAAPALQVLAPQGAGSGNGGTPSTTDTPEEQQYEIDCETVKMHERRGVPQDEIGKLASFTRKAAFEAAHKPKE